MNKEQPTKKSKAKSKATSYARNIQIDSEFGNICISDFVIAHIVKHYALTVPGVVAIAGRSIVGGIADFFGKRPSEQNIAVTIDKDQIYITVTIIVAFGEHLPTVGINVQNICRKYIEELTGQRVGKIEVIIQSLDTTSEDKDLNQHNTQK